MGRPTALIRLAVIVVSGIYSILLLTLDIKLPALAKVLISALPTLAVVVVVIWDIAAWRIMGLQGLTRRPDMRGAWRVTMTPHPDSHIPTGGNWGPIDGFLEVRQTFWAIHLRLYTEQSASQSTAASWLPTFESAVDALTFAYLNTPKVSEMPRSTRSAGACSLTPTSLKPTAMDGYYFTDRLTMGDISLVFVSRETGHASYAAALKYTEAHQRT